LLYVPAALLAETSTNHLPSDKQLPEESDRVSDGRFPLLKKNFPNPIRAGNAENSDVRLCLNPAKFGAC
jgi:hypothetical protein